MTGSTIVTDKIKTRVEQYLNIDLDLFKFENVINNFFLFSKETRREQNEQKVYYLTSDKSVYLEIDPPKGYSIPGNFEEKVLIALIKIMKNNNYNKAFTTSFEEIQENLKENRIIQYTELNKSLYSLSHTLYKFSNSINLSTLSNIKESLSFNLMNINAVEDKKCYQITFTNEFYNSIIIKEYLTFNLDLLLKIENGILRSLYMLIEKLRSYELYLKIPEIFITRRIPLSLKEIQINKTLTIIEEALIELKELNLIKNFNIIKDKKIELAEIEIFFDTFHNEVKRVI